MKRIGYLFEQAFCFEGLHAAYRKAYQGSRHSLDARSFAFGAELRLCTLEQELKEGIYHPAPYRHFQIRDPKPRTISVAPFVDRVVHHAIIRVLEPIFEPMFIQHSYATRKGKGQHKALDQAQRYLRNHRWFYKSDIRQYFLHIDHEILLCIIRRKVKDARFLDVVEKVVRNGGSQGKGLPIGNLTSQFFANVYLNQFDHWVRCSLGFPAYIRYMDDFVLFHEDREKLKAARRTIAGYLGQSLGLEINTDHAFINQRSNGLSFLGARVFPRCLRIHPANLKRCTRRMLHSKAAYQRGDITEQQYLDSLQSRWAWISAFDSLSLRKKWLTCHGQ